MQKIQTCFIIDDDSVDRDMLIETISELDETIRCYAASDGEHALTMLKSWLPEKPDIIFLDLNMPRMDGKKLIKAIKQNETFNLIPVAIYTTSSNPKDKEEMIKFGADWVITKPHTLRELKEAVSSILEP